MALLAASQNLLGKFTVRQPFPLWTSRRILNGVIQLKETLLGDADLYYVITGVMDDIKVWCDANSITYSGWTNLILVPRAIIRGTTYGVVAALYARHTRTFQGRVIPTVAPVTITVAGDEERAMTHWQDKMKEMLDLYLSAEESTRLWVSTADEEPIFSMADIPETPAVVDSWHEYLQELI